MGDYSGILVMVGGLDLSGKDTFVDSIAEYLEKKGKKVFDLREYGRIHKEPPEPEELEDYDVILSGEPTFFWTGLSIRNEIVTKKRPYPAHLTAHAFALDRYVLYQRLIIPLLKKGKIILQARGVISSMAYQPLQAEFQGEELTLKQVMDLPGNQFTLKYAPDLMLISSCPAEECMRRKYARKKQDQSKFEELDFLKALEKRYKSNEIINPFKERGTMVLYLDTNISIPYTKAAAIEAFEHFLDRRKEKTGVITISGPAGSGKSTAAKLLAKKLNYNHYSMGDLRKKMAEEQGISLAELNKIGEKEDFTDKEVDNYQIKLGKNENNFVIDGRLSFHFIPQAINIYITADVKERARRIYIDERKTEKFNSLKETRKALIERDKSDKKRYLKYYNVDPHDKTCFDHIMDTTYLTPEETVNLILKKLKPKSL